MHALEELLSSVIFTLPYTEQASMCEHICFFSEDTKGSAKEHQAIICHDVKRLK